MRSSRHLLGFSVLGLLGVGLVAPSASSAHDDSLQRTDRDEFERSLSGKPPNHQRREAARRLRQQARIVAKRGET